MTSTAGLRRARFFAACVAAGACAMPAVNAWAQAESAERPTQAYARAASPWRVYGSLGMAFGGSSAIDGIYVTKDSAGNRTPTGKSFSIQAGEGWQLLVGASYSLTDQASIQLAAGTHISTAGEGGDSKFELNRVPVELLGFLDLDGHWRLGGGLRWARGAQLITSGPGVQGRDDSESYDTSTGAVLETQYLFDNFHKSGLQPGLSLRLVSESYVGRTSGTRLNGNSIGFGFFVYY